METDDKGELDFDLKPGGYELSVSRRGFKEFTTNIDAQAAKRQTLPVVLQVAKTVGGLPMETPPPTLELRFPFRNPAPLGAADLQIRPHIMVTVHNLHTNADENYSGLRLADLLARHLAATCGARPYRTTSWPPALMGTRLCLLWRRSILAFIRERSLSPTP
jgi:hypothetical protein